MANKKPDSKQETSRPDGRRPFMTYMDPELIKALKRRALDSDTYAYELVEKFVEAGLAHEGKSPKSD